MELSVGILLVAIHFRRREISCPTVVSGTQANGNTAEITAIANRPWLKKHVTPRFIGVVNFDDDDDDDDDVGGGQEAHTFLSFHKRRSLDRCARMGTMLLLLFSCGQFGEG